MMLSRPSLAARKAFTAIPSPIGYLVVTATWKGIERLVVAGNAETARLVGSASAEWHESHAHPHLQAACHWLQDYFDGRRNARPHADVSFDLSGTPFQRRVWEVIASIPYGATICYTELARRTGKAEAVRAAGTACGSNPVPLLIPCHRIIAKDGKLGGFGLGLAAKTWLLGHEREAADVITKISA